MDPITLAAAAAIGGSVLQFGGSMQAAKATKEAGQRQRVASEFAAAQQTQNAGQAIAAAQRKASEQERRSRLVASRALAVSAAGGGSASDTTVENIISDIAGEGAYRAGVELYQGEERARQLRMGADASMYEGAVAEAGAKAKARAIKTEAFGKLIGSAGSLYGKYGMGGPSSGGERFDASVGFDDYEMDGQN